MRPTKLTIAVVCSALSFSACNSVDESVQLNQVNMPSEGRIAWGDADKPEIVDIDSSFKTKLADLPTTGEANRIPWASDYWGTYKDSINFKWPGKDKSAPQKFGEAFGKANIEDGISAGYGIDSRPTADLCSSDDDCESKNGVGTACAKREGETKGYCMETWTGICHAWAPVAIMEREPEHSVTHNGVEFGVLDLKALATLAFDKGLQS